ncbi:hypothetical protein ACNKHU_00545 [Shigella flexneri]
MAAILSQCGNTLFTAGNLTMTSVYR